MLLLAGEDRMRSSIAVHVPVVVAGCGGIESEVVKFKIWKDAVGVRENGSLGIEN